MKSDLESLKEMRKKIFLTAYSGGTAHLASAFSVAEIFYALYAKEILNYDKENPLWIDRDRLILSKGHASLALYVSLAMVGILSEKELYTFCNPGSRLGGEANMVDIPGVEASTGSLGHGLSFGVGIAIANKLDGKINNTYVIIGDGESEEGVIWEAVMTAHKFKLDKLTVILDCNKIQKMGFIKDTMGIESWNSKWCAFDWYVEEISDGNDIDEVYNVLSKENTSGKPRLIIANTIKGKGISIMENNPDWHFKMPNKRQLKIFMQELDIREEELNYAKGIY